MRTLVSRLAIEAGIVALAITLTLAAAHHKLRGRT